MFWLFTINKVFPIWNHAYFDINPQRIAIQLAISSRLALRLTQRDQLWVTDGVSSTTSIDNIYKYHLKYTKNNKRFSQEALTRYSCPNCTRFHTIDFLGKYNFILYTITASRNYNTISYLPNITVMVFGKWNHSFIYKPNWLPSALASVNIKPWSIYRNTTKWR